MNIPGLEEYQITEKYADRSVDSDRYHEQSVTVQMVEVWAENHSCAQHIGSYTLHFGGCDAIDCWGNAIDIPNLLALYNQEDYALAEIIDRFRDSVLQRRKALDYFNSKKQSAKESTAVCHA